MGNVSIIEFYKEIFGDSAYQLENFLESHGSNNLGHFNVFDTAKFYYSGNKKSDMTYNRRLYYKISLIKGKNLVEYAGKTVLIGKRYSCRYSCQSEPERESGRSVEVER